MIGYVDVKTSPVFFYAQKTSRFTTLNSVIPFDLLRLNLGNAMNTSGIFVTPTPGKYFFSYSGLSHANLLGRVELQMWTAATDWVKIGQAFGSVSVQTFSLQANLKLAKGDQIRLLLAEGGIEDDANHYTNFVGQLLEEDIIQ
ncbi:C1q and tumor necrosis factor-related protein-like protein 3 isoform b isoform 2 [Daphnia pulex]|uniref:C1q and tumor necrosis factor-related protein-like protein 3 isoform b isoform 2 n=1 Tax=Daphnia pulex TaxID=6669 RepID=E9GY71_DAPPU|nr:C1q and tumor necrosis factor-related protein-like protein 3 isoform b isoform 2 [Daphnia pulex]|eukprot:EFX75550.1 C1q and tumor necrosis factor-related protein-like protein 3 isoform b isoform 2 [Daphnia pulex]